MKISAVNPLRSPNNLVPKHNFFKFQAKTSKMLLKSRCNHIQVQKSFGTLERSWRRRRKKIRDVISFKIFLLSIFWRKCSKLKFPLDFSKDFGWLIFIFLKKNFFAIFGPNINFSDYSSRNQLDKCLKSSGMNFMVLGTSTF